MKKYFILIIGMTIIGCNSKIHFSEYGMNMVFLP